MSAACAALRMQVAAYADDELGVDAALPIERHLAGCAGCRRTVARQRHLARALRDLHPVDAPSAGFEARVRRAVVGQPLPPRRMLAAGVAAAAVAGVLGWYGASALRDASTSRDATSRATAVGDERAPATGSLAETAIATAVALHRGIDDRTLPFPARDGDVEGVNAWLATHLPFPADVRRPGSPAIAIAGASVVALGDHAAGLVRYRLEGRAVSLFLLPEPVWSESHTAVRVGTTDFRVFRRAGVDVVGWSHARVAYLLVSDDGLATGAACGTCHGDDGRGAIAAFVRAVRGESATDA